MKPSSINVLILCGGLGKRLRPVIGESPKPMARVHEEPFLNILLRYFKEQGFRRIILGAGYKGEVVRDYYRKNNLGLEVEVSLEKSPLGTGGAIKYARRLISSDPFIIVNGDSFCPVNYKKFLKFHEYKKAIASVVVVKVKDQKDYGSIVFNRSKKIIGFLEKIDFPKIGEGYVNAGIGCFNQEIFSTFPKRTEVFSLEYDVFPRLVKNKFFAFESKADFIDIGTPERYRKAQTFLKEEYETAQH